MDTTDENDEGTADTWRQQDMKRSALICFP